MTLVIIETVIQSEYAQRGCNLRQIEGPLSPKTYPRIFGPPRVSGDVIPKSAYLEGRHFERRSLVVEVSCRALLV